MGYRRWMFPMCEKKTNASPREDFILPRTCRILLFTCSSPQVEVLIFMADSNHSNTHPTPPHPPLSLAGIFITICHMMCNDPSSYSPSHHHLYPRPSLHNTHINNPIVPPTVLYTRVSNKQDILPIYRDTKMSQL